MKGFIMTEFEEFKEFFDKHGVNYEASDYLNRNKKGQSYILLVNDSLEFKDGIFTHMYGSEFDVKVERLPDGK
jgi:hypothetical protein